MRRDKRFNKGDIVKHRLNGKTGIVVSVCKRKREQTSIYVMLSNTLQRWRITRSIVKLAKPNPVS